MVVNNLLAVANCGYSLPMIGTDILQVKVDMSDMSDISDIHQQELLTRFSLSDGCGCAGDQTGPARDREE